MNKNKVFKTLAVPKLYFIDTNFPRDANSHFVWKGLESAGLKEEPNLTVEFQ